MLTFYKVSAAISQLQLSYGCFNKYTKGSETSYVVSAICCTEKTLAVNVSMP